MPAPDLARHLDDLSERVGPSSPTARSTSTHAFLTTRVTFASSDERALHAFIDPFGHTVADGKTTGARAYLVDASEVADATFFRDGGLRDGRLEPGVGSAWYDAGTQTVRIADHQRLVHYLVHRGLRAQEWQRPEFARTFLESILQDSGFVSLHGATVGDADRCLLLTGKGGAGKSTLVAQALAIGYRTVGDDYLLYAPADTASVGTLVSAFRTVKVARSGAASALFSTRPTATSADGSKHLLHPGDDRPDCFVGSQVPVAVAVPAFGPRFDATPIDRIDVLRALLPTSAQMSIQPGRMITALTRLVDGLPAVRITLSPRFEDDREALGRFLASLGIDVPAPPVTAHGRTLPR
jgi:hypothetical protein